MPKRTQNLKTVMVHIKDLFKNKIVIIISPLFMKMNSLLILKRKLSYLIHLLLKNVPLNVATVKYRPNSITLPKNVYQLLSCHVTVYSINSNN